MKTTHQPCRQWLLSMTFTLWAAGAIPWQLVPGGALAQDSPVARPATEPVTTPKGERGPIASPERTFLAKVTEARVRVARAKRKVAEDLVEQAEAEAAQATAMREYREKSHYHMVRLDKTRSVPHELVDEDESLLREAQAAEREAKARTPVSRASLEAAEAAVREADAQRDVTATESNTAPDAKAENELKAARIRLREARRDRIRAECKIARAEVDRAKASLEKSKATVEYRSMRFERFKHLLEVKAIDQKVLDEQEQSLIEARNTAQNAEVAVGVARTGLKSAKARLKSTEGKAIKPGGP